MPDDCHVVAFGGGTGLPLLLRGLRQTCGDGVHAVVTVADDGGSSGRLRQELGVAPPGDVRRCLVALAERRELASVFEYRFETGAELRDHAVGNLIIAALADMSGGFLEGVEQAGRFLRIRGAVLPATTESVTLIIHHTDGSVTRGESTPREPRGPVRRVTIDPEHAVAPVAVIEAIARAGVVVLSSGSLFTSTIPSLLGWGTSRALADFERPVVYVANIMTQPGETDGFALSDHLRAVFDHVGPVITDVLVHSEELPAQLLSRYQGEGAQQVQLDREKIERLGVRLHSARLLPDPVGVEARHDPHRLAAALLEIAARPRSVSAYRSQRSGKGHLS